MKNYIEYLERQIEKTLEDKDLHREHWAFCQALRKYRELALDTSGVSNSEAAVCPGCKSKNTFYAKGNFYYCRDCETPFD